jgi:hypothetical protein
MTKVVLDADLRAKLMGGNGGIEFTDEQGTVIGHYLTDQAYSHIFELIQPPLTKLETVEVRKEMLANGGASTADILEAIESAKREWEARR